MDEIRLLRLQPTLKMIWEELKNAGTSCCLVGEDDGRNYRSVRMYSETVQMSPDILYIEENEDGWPCIATYLRMHGPYIRCPDLETVSVLALLLDLFSSLQQMEMELDDLVYRGANLDELCEAGARMLENPICIHDDWFVMIAKSGELSQVLKPDYIMSSSKEFVPQVVLEDFKFDSDYLETYSYRTAQFWNSSPDAGPCIYVNMWDGSVYCGRVLVVRYHREFRGLDYLVAEVLTQRVMMILRRNRPGENRPLRSMDDVVYELLTEGHSDSQEVSRLMEMLGWSKQDRMLCIRIKHQQNQSAVTMEHLLHSDLFRSFPGSYILLTGQQQCVIMNLEKESASFPNLRHRLAPLCRDYCLYAGISAPVNGIRELYLAYHQADVALKRAFQKRSDQWIVPFSDCALDYLLNHLDSPLQKHHLIAPELYRLMEHDAERGTQYFETLRTFLLKERDIPSTSDALIIHRTTLLYRLKKIQALTDLNLDDANVRLYLLLSLRILDQESL